jgi:hypothetical protein
VTPIKNLKSNGLAGINEIPAKFVAVEVKHYVVRCANFVIMFETGKNGYFSEGIYYHFTFSPQI